ncbi:MAG: type VI secretion system-associated protein TagO [Gilliamella sp.]|uniref:type VI secretion system-associated protein VasI n=1 Tax=Gilliamella sp. TaxID=1891236 RepID=UPI0025CCF7A8|nr:type VI secretion system-associated protein VasI [Gilliamella sp.]MCO6538088.1 type VI secretion system-associated protein TagO [Gilliamella sp.]MCO6540253.1 type VI secretion system-associated protein TagO [Gilliamella sp.]
MSFANATLNDKEILNLLAQCTKETSALTRLECYDNILHPNNITSLPNDEMVQHSPLWFWIVEQEKTRTENSPHFILNTSDNNSRVLLTTYAIGLQPPRPILAFSCIDNITRMQIVLFNPINYKNTKLQLVTENDVVKVNWFVRDNGFIFESSRGLLGIEQIKRILNAKSLTLKSDDPKLNGLVFNLTTLNSSIKFLRTACHW